MCRYLDKLLPSRASGKTLSTQRWGEWMVKVYLFESENVLRGLFGVLCRWLPAQQRSSQFRLLRRRFSLRGPKPHSFKPRFMQLPDTVWHIVSLRDWHHLCKCRSDDPPIISGRIKRICLNGGCSCVRIRSRFGPTTRSPRVEAACDFHAVRWAFSLAEG